MPSNEGSKYETEAENEITDAGENVEIEKNMESPESIGDDFWAQ